MKHFFILLLLIVSLKAESQNTERLLLLKDLETNLPVEDATVFISKTKQSLLSNSEGAVRFVLSGQSTIQISHTSYLSVTVRSITLKNNENVIYLKANLNNLDEIIITKQHPQKILKSLIQNSIKKLTIPVRLKVYAREFFKLNGVYSYYNDGLMNFQLFGKTNNLIPIY